MKKKIGTVLVWLTILNHSLAIPNHSLAILNHSLAILEKLESYLESDGGECKLPNFGGNK